MRATVAVLGSASILIIGYYAISQAAEESEQTANDAGAEAQTSWDIANSVFDGVGMAAGEAIVWVGIIAIVILMLGVLVVSGRGR